jgi:hypothetical protein
MWREKSHCHVNKKATLLTCGSDFFPATSAKKSTEGVNKFVNIAGGIFKKRNCWGKCSFTLIYVEGRSLKLKHPT